MCLLTGHFVKLKSVIFLLCNLEAISSNFIPVKFSGHTVCSTHSVRLYCQTVIELYNEKLCRHFSLCIVICINHSYILQYSTGDGNLSSDDDEDEPVCVITYNQYMYIHYICKCNL